MNTNNNTRALQKEISKKLSQSEMWLVLRMDKNGVHLHTPSEDHLALFGVFFGLSPEMFELVKDCVSAYKERHP